MSGRAPAAALLCLLVGCASGTGQPPIGASPSAVPTPVVPTPVATLAATTVAGGPRGHVDASGTAARFSFPAGVALDQAGNLYVGDFSNNRIRKLAPDGAVTTVVGDGTQRFADGTGTAARFYYPLGVAMGPDGNLYVADCSNHRVRRVTPAGVATTLAGGEPGMADGTGTAARFNSLRGVAVGPDGVIYVADTDNNRIRRVDMSGVVTTVAGDGRSRYADGTGTAAGLFSPEHLAVGPDGTIYVADTYNNRIRRIDAQGAVTTLAGGEPGMADGTGSAARFNHPAGVAVGPAGTLYVADTDNHRVCVLGPGGVVTTLAGAGAADFADGTGTGARFRQPYHMAVAPDGSLLLADAGNHRIRRLR